MASRFGRKPKWRWRDQLPPVRAARLTRRRRWWLSRAGRRDGRRSMPEFTLAAPGVTTLARVEIERQMMSHIAAVQQIYGRRAAPHVLEKEEAERRIKQLQDDLGQTRAWLEAAERNRPNPEAAAQRRRGETLQTETVVQSRRAREFDQQHLAPLRQKVASLTAQEMAERQRRDKAAAQIAALDSERALIERWISSLQLHARSLYDQALVRRHPQGDFIGPLLDGATLNLPAWPLPEWLTRPPIRGESGQ